MEKITTSEALKNAIRDLEYQRANDMRLLKEEFHTTIESLKPVNMIKRSFKDLTSAPDFKENLSGTAIGLTAGYLSRLLFIGSSHNPIKKLLGSVFQVAVSSAVAKKSDTIKSLAGKIVTFFRKKKEAKVEDLNEYPV